VLAPVDQGQLRSSLTMEMDEERGLPVVRVGTNVKYAIWVHEGTGIYGPRKTPIRPVRARVLRWPVKNNTGSGRRRYRGGATENYAYAKQVKGSPGRPFLTKALKTVTGQS
jgi:phage gpG-like protein